MASENGTLEFRVGLFVLIGLVIIGYMVVSVGRFSNGLKTFYPVTVELPNASGLLKNSKVLLAGASIGTAGAPEVLPSGLGVRVPLLIDTRVQIARNSRLVVGSSGLMGSRNRRGRFSRGWQPAIMHAKPRQQRIGIDRQIAPQPQKPACAHRQIGDQRRPFLA